MNNNTRSITWMIAWAIAFSLSMSCIKCVKTTPLIIVIFFRFLFAFIVSGIQLLNNNEFASIKQNINQIGSKYLLVFFAYACLIYSAIWSNYYAYEQLPLSLATTLGFTTPMITIILAIFILKDKVNKQKWFSLGVGYIGVLIIMQPESKASVFVIFIAILSNFLAGFAKIIAKHLTKIFTTIQLMFLTNVFSSIVGGLTALYIWQTPALADIPYIIGVLLFGTLSQFFLLKAIHYGNFSLIEPFSYLRLFFAIPIGLIFFGDTLLLNHVLGAICILFGSAYLTYIQLKKEK